MTPPVIVGLPHRLAPVRYLHQGTFADVVEATDHDRGMSVALKILHAQGTQAPVARAMFRRETEALKGLSNDAIVQIVDSYEIGADRLCIELELVPGGRTLADLLDDVRTGKLAKPSLEWRLRTVHRLADAVVEAHRRNVIHRDLKPQNVLWSRDEDLLKLADFGIALVLPLTVREPRGATLRSFYSPPYASPEQRLQQSLGFPSDVYGFGLLTAAILSLVEPGEDFAAAELPALVSRALGEVVACGIAEADAHHLGGLLARALLDAPAERPSLTEIRDCVGRILSNCVPLPEAAFLLTKKAKERLDAAGFSSLAGIADDFNADLRVRWYDDDERERIKIFGATLFAVLAWDAEDPDGEILRAVDAGQNSGPKHESDRQRAQPAGVRLRCGTGSGRELLRAAQEARRHHDLQALEQLLDRAQLIIDLERERLPCFRLACDVEGGVPLPGRRDERMGQASGYVGAAVEEVELRGGFRLRVRDARPSAPPTKANRRSSTAAAAPATVHEEPLPIDDVSFERDWYSMFDDPKALEIVGADGHILGKVTGYDDEARLIHVNTDKRRRVPVRGELFVKSNVKEKLLIDQNTALHAVKRGETARADMRLLLCEPAAHRMADNRFRDLLQSGLHPADRVRALVNRVLASQSVFCLQGPPGTGKTTVIAEIVAQTLDIDPRARILVCSQANEAVANAVERIRKVRGTLGKDWIIVRDVRKELAEKEGDWSGYDAAYAELKKSVGQRVLDQFKGRLRPDASGSPDVHRALGEAQTGWLECVETGSGHVDRDFRKLVQVWGTSTARSSRPLAKLEGDYDLVIIDEAAKATVGEVLIPLVRARRLLLVGDQKQLPPFLETTTVAALAQFGVSEDDAKRSLFEHLFSLVPAAHRGMLDVQFRMHPSIGDLVSKLFYEGKVKNGPGTEDRPLPPGDFDRSHRVMWLDVDGRDYQVGATSRANDEERRVIFRLLDKLNGDAHRAKERLSVAVIAAYRGQADLLEREMPHRSGAWKALDVRAATVDSFQGREADVVVYSMVRTGTAPRDFIADGRRFNVALSRARNLLMVIGDRRGALGTERLRELIEMIPLENQLTADEFVPKDRQGMERR